MTIKHLVPFLLTLALGMTAQGQQTQAVKDWNFLVYVNGVNSLDQFGSLNINQMEQIGSNDRMNVLVEWGSMNFKTAKRMLIQKDNDTNTVTSPVVSEVQNPDFGSSQELSNFIDWAAQTYPAKHYFIVVWDHGNGWHITKDGMQTKDISIDDRTGHRITTEQLGEVMTHAAQTIGHKVDVYASDACLMGMIEVAGEMTNAVSYFVGSQDLEPGEGWPYNVFLDQWQKNMDLPPLGVAQLLSKEYAGAYSGGIYGNQSVTMSVFDLNQIPAYYTAMNKLTNELKALSGTQLAAAKKAAAATKYYYLNDYKDAADFLAKLELNSVKAQSASEVRAAFQQLVISNDQNIANTVHGLSIWMPSSSGLSTYGNRYKKLAFNVATGWSDFLALLVK